MSRLIVTTQDTSLYRRIHAQLRPHGHVLELARTAGELHRIARQARPDAVLVDCEGTPPRCTETLRRLKARPRYARLLIIALLDNERCVSRPIEAAGVKTLEVDRRFEVKDLGRLLDDGVASVSAADEFTQGKRFDFDDVDLSILHDQLVNIETLESRPTSQPPLAKTDVRIRTILDDIEAHMRPRATDKQLGPASG